MNLKSCFTAILLSIVATAFQFASYGQGVGIGTSSPNNSAILDLNSATKGFLPPRMTSLQRRAISSPASGLVVYDTDTDTFWFCDTGVWNELITANKLSNSLPKNRLDPSGDEGNNFGFSLSLGRNGNVGLVGSPMLNNGGKGACHFLTYTENNLWGLTALNPTGLANGDAYGYAVAMDRDNGSDMGVVSAPFDDSSTVSNMGCVYFFENQAFRNKVYAPADQRVANAKFGRSVDISGESGNNEGFAIVGAPGANEGKGAAFIYKYNPNTDTWAFQATLTDNNGALADSFGLAVSLYYNPAGDTAWAFIGAPYDDDGSFINRGSVTVYRKASSSDVWTRVAKIISNTYEGFGYALDDVFRCGHLFVGTPFKFSGIGGMTRVTLSSFSGSTATFSQALMPEFCCSSGVGLPGIGFCVSAASNSSSSCNQITILSGSFSGYISNTSSSNFGYVYMYRFNGSSYTVEKLTDPSIESTGYGFGRALSIHGSSQHVLIGSPNERVEGMNERGKIQFRKLKY